MNKTSEKITQNKDREKELLGERWVSHYNELLENAHARQQELQKELSKYDSEQDDILHYIEMRKCDAIMSAKLMKRLKVIREERRVVKEELNAVRSILSLSKKSKYKNNETYVFKTNVIIDMLEEGEDGYEYEEN